MFFFLFFTATPSRLLFFATRFFLSRTVFRFCFPRRIFLRNLRAVKLRLKIKLKIHLQRCSKRCPSISPYLFESIFVTTLRLIVVNEWSLNRVKFCVNSRAIVHPKTSIWPVIWARGTRHDLPFSSIRSKFGSTDRGRHLFHCYTEKHTRVHAVARSQL